MVDSSASVSMRHSNVAPKSLRNSVFRNVAFSLNKPFASGPSLVAIDSVEKKRKRHSKNNTISANGAMKIVIYSDSSLSLALALEPGVFLPIKLYADCIFS